MSLDAQQQERYQRNILIAGIGADGQEKLLKSRALVIGAGGLGSPAALYLAAAGVGYVGIADSDAVELSNLQRQIIHATGDIGAMKTESAARKIIGLNPDVHVEKLSVRIDGESIFQCIDGYDFIIDATDNFDSKFCINDACVRAGVPFSHAGVCGFRGQTMTVVPGKSPCYRCVFKQSPPPESCPTTAREGILGAVAGIIGATQALECIKYLCGCGGLLTGRLFVLDAKAMDCRTVDVKRDRSCGACADLFPEE
jgi:molybdopterin/thiamine biosynthesis adenylyltransferase